MIEKDKKLLNPYIKFAKSSKDVALWQRIEKRSFFDFGFRIYYIVPELLETNNFYGEYKLKYSEIFETVVKMTSDNMSDQFIEYAKLGLDWQQDLMVPVVFNNDLFEEHVNKELYKYHKSLERPFPKEGDLIYFYQFPNDENPNNITLHYPYLFKISSVVYQDPSDLTHYYKKINTKVLLRPYKENTFNELTDEVKEELNMEDKVKNEIEYIEEFADNLPIENDDDLDIIKKQQGVDL